MDASKIADALPQHEYAKQCWDYITHLVNIVREPMLVLDKDLRVMAANDSFYRTFQVEQKDTEGAVVYTLGNGQWNIPALRTLLEEILPQNTFFNNFEIEHTFSVIGHKSMMLNARQVQGTGNGTPALLPPIIILAIEDATPLMAIAETLASHMKGIAAEGFGQNPNVPSFVEKLEKDLALFKKSPFSRGSLHP